ncbi:ankyrin repeat domain-containing protein 12 isoform X1 [Acyrthosiphon pisum]|uniref:Ankyrin repeat domain-containing protein 12 n=2 Tax=Acyrthosiphon pisum TaxID=7029 RepID=A0A8R2B481_ACYPI|nr:ankyrin repeat domain-containing protein 12 isoform X1 [Acyrthosiphon pisum]|eukprot:XP_008180982.1 PREDICTED: ankyrin repeat domain-containing protein 12 isoform X1 [Acyrthosiphon pisum]
MTSVNPVKRSTRLAGKRHSAVIVALGGGYTTDCGDSSGLRNERDAANSDKQQHASPRVTLRLTNTGNNQFKSSSARQDEKNKKIAEEQTASMTNDTKTVETEEKPETPTQSVSQSANVSTSVPVESTSASTSKETESKDGGSVEATDTVNSSSNESAVKPLKETDNLKRSIVEEDEEVKPKKRKEDHSQSSKGKTEASSPKPDSDEDKSGGSGPSNADSPGGGPKVPPLKIVIPTTDADTGTRTNGKNGNRSHHTALPYVVPSEESPPASNQPNSPKSPQKATTDTIAVEEQKSPQTRVLRSSNRCGSNSSGAPSRGTSPIVPDEQLAQTTSPASVTVDAGSGNPSPSAARSEQTENVSTILSGDDKQATTTAAATATTTSESTVTAELSGMELHPRRRKLKASRTESENSDTSSAANVTAVETNPSGTTSEPAPVTNCYQMFLNIRKQIDKRRKNLFPVQPKPPSGFKDYLMNRCTYVLAGNSNSRVVNTQTPSPANLHEQLKKLFVEQEKERQRLRVQHIVEKEKLVLSVEQEILRVHGRAARALANQLLPFSVCTILKDDEVYNIMTPEQEEEKDRHARSRYNGRLFLSWLQDVDDKWEKIKESMLLRHHNEAESLHAVQKMDWGWKLKELQLCTYSSEPNIDEEHVPMVLVSDDFDLLPA